MCLVCGLLTAHIINVIGYYNNWRIIHCIASRKQHESMDTDINDHTKHNSIGNIDLNIGKDIGGK